MISGIVKSFSESAPFGEAWKELNKPENSSNPNTPQSERGLFRLLRRLMAMLYDAFLITAVMFAISAVAVALNGGNAVDSPTFYLVLMLVPPCFFLWFWLHGGQTLGMSAWQLRLTGPNQQAVTAWQCIKRLALALITLAPFGLGLLWMLIDRDNRTLYGRFSGTKISRYKKN